MRMWVILVLLAAMLAVRTDAKLPSPESPYNILMLLPFSSKSHRNVFLPLANALADRGHKITLVALDDPITKHPNIVEYQHLEPKEMKELEELFNNLSIQKNDPNEMIIHLKKVIDVTAQHFYDFPHIKELYVRKKEFDLIVIDHMFNELAYPFAHEQTWITINTGGMDYRQCAIYGNVQNPAFVSNMFDDYPRPFSMVDRIQNIFFQIAFAQLWRRSIVSSVEHHLAKHFPNLPSLLEIERNQSLVLMNYHVSMGIPLALLPNEVEVGGMHCRPAKQLPEKMLEFIEGSGSAGVIYFSLGSVAKGNRMPAKYRAMFVEVFSQLEQRIIWKFEEELQGLSDNVMLTDWAPQQDILAHPSVKVFISHNGLLGTQEAVYHGTPILGLPIYGDQPKNAKMIAAKDFGLYLLWEELTTEKIVNALKEIIYNDKYQKSISAASRLFRDQPETPVERAVFWTEYVIRHHGATHLRSPGAQLSWIQYFMIDAICVILITLFVVFKLFMITAKKIKNKLFGGTSKTKSD